MKRLIAVILAAVSILGLTGCSAKNGQNGNGSNQNKVQQVAVSEIVKAVQSVYGDSFAATLEYTKTDLTEKFGIQPEWYEEAQALGPMITVHVDTFVAVKAKDGHTEDVKKALEDYLTKLKNDSLQYPANQIKIQAARVDVYENYVFFTMLGFPSEDEGDEAALAEAYGKQNQMAIEAIEGVLYGI